MTPSTAKSRSTRPLALLLELAALATILGAPVAVSAPHDARADNATIDYVDCRWTPFHDAWGCTLPQDFSGGRFGTPPEFKQDELSTQLRQRAWSDAKTFTGARARGRVGVFVPQQDGSWLFVPGLSWSPGEIVFLPPAPKPKEATAKKG